MELHNLWTEGLHNMGHPSETYFELKSLKIFFV